MTTRNHTTREKLKHLGYETKDVFVLYTNTDLTEGRGNQYPISVCESESTAIREGCKKGVQGTDIRAEKEFAVRIDGNWFASVNIIKPTSDDEMKDETAQKIQAIKEKLKNSGLTAEEMVLLNLSND